MKKVIAVAAVVAGVVVVGRRVSCKAGSFDWERAFERMPDSAPPKWMFRNISAIRENTDRILELLEREQANPSEPAEPTPAS